MYQPSRWYDAYPNLVSALNLVRLMPAERQERLGERLNTYLAHRSVQGLGSNLSAIPSGNRWYDAVPVLCDSLERLKNAPPTVKHQTGDYLARLITAVRGNPAYRAS